MSDGMTDGGAPAPADSGSAPIDPGVQAPNPVRADPPDAAPKPAPEEPKPAPSARDALKRATEKVEAEGKADKPAPKPVESKPDGKEKPAETAPKPEAAQRAPDGKFAARETPQGQEAASQADASADKPEGGQREAAPERFAADAKAEWEKSPEPVRREVARMHREMQAGIDKYRGDAEAFNEVRDFHDQVSKNGQSLRGVLTDVAAMEQAILTDPVRGLDMVCRRLGTTFADVIQRVTGQDVDQNTRQMQGQLAQVHAENQRLTGLLQSMHRASEQKEMQAAQSQIEAFAADNPHFEALKPKMGVLLSQGLAQDLPEAYAMAARMAGVASSPPIPAPNPAPVPAASPQTRAGTRSIAGAPTPGSDPAARKPASSVKEALKRAVAQAG